jgi:hypothetical protein
MSIEMIGYDSYFNHDPSTASQIEVTPAAMMNDAAIPCDTCKFAASCATKVTECSAFRVWSKTGQYADSDVGRLVRAIKSGTTLTVSF